MEPLQDDVVVLKDQTNRNVKNRKHKQRDFETNLGADSYEDKSEQNVEIQQHSEEFKIAESNVEEMKTREPIMQKKQYKQLK